MARPIQIALRVPAIRFGLIPHFHEAENRLQSSNRNDQDGCGFRRKGDRQRDLFECFFHGLSSLQAYFTMKAMPKVRIHFRDPGSFTALYWLLTNKRRG